MLKITTHMDDSGIMLELEGRLVGPWVEELEQCWRRALLPDRPVRVLLKAVTFIDDGGRALLCHMHREGVELAGEGCMTKAILDDIAIRGS